MIMAQIEINDDVVDALVVSSLKQVLECLRADIVRLQNMPTPLSRVNKQDLEDMLSYEPALVKTLQYYTSHDEWKNI